jgi:uncharacterized protein (TIGR03437 family)
MLRFGFVVCALLTLGSSPSAFAQSAVAPPHAAAFQWINQVDSSSQDSVAGLGIDAAGNSYVAGSTYSLNFPVLNAAQPQPKITGLGTVNATRDVYVTKLDPSGNLVYSTYFGGTGDDVATALTVDSSGNIYVTGTTTSLDFPVTPGAYAATGGSFVFKLNPAGSLGYSTYFAPVAPSENPTALGTALAAIAVDSSGSVYLAGTSSGNLPITAGAVQPSCALPPSIGLGFFSQVPTCGFASKLDPTGSKLLYSGYVGPVVADFGLDNLLMTSLAIGMDGTAYLGGAGGIFHLNAAGSALLATIAVPPFGTSSGLVPQTLALAPDGTLYAAGHASTFQTTLGAFETSVSVAPKLPGQDPNAPTPAVIARWDPQLANVLDATYLGGGRSYSAVYSIAFDSSGNVYLGGATDPQGLLTRTPLQLGFAPDTGFLSELSGDLSTLLFSSYFGDTQDFNVAGLGVRNDGSVALAGYAWQPNGTPAHYPNNGGGSLWVNSLTLAPAPALRVDSVMNAASLLDGAISAGETIVVQGAGFGTNPQLSIGGISVPAISSTSTSITATVPQAVGGTAVVQVSSGGAVSNQVAVEVAPTAPGIFSQNGSQNGSGFGQGYILNNDGTLNSPTNPAAPGEAISVFATGVGPVSYVQGYAVSQYPVDVYIDQINCNGIEAFMGPVAGLPGNVYQIQVYVPVLAKLRVAQPYLPPSFPPLALLNMVVNGVASQNGIAISVSQ